MLNKILQYQIEIGNVKYERLIFFISQKYLRQLAIAAAMSTSSVQIVVFSYHQKPELLGIILGTFPHLG